MQTTNQKHIERKCKIEHDNEEYQVIKLQDIVVVL